MGVFLQRCTVSPVALDQPLARRACGGGAFRVRPTFRTVVGCSWPRLRAGDRKAPPTAYPCLCRRALFVHDEVTELVADLAQESSWLVEVATTLQALRRLEGGLVTQSVQPCLQNVVDRCWSRSGRREAGQSLGCQGSHRVDGAFRVSQAIPLKRPLA